MNNHADASRAVGRRMGHDQAVTYLTGKWDRLRAAVAAKDGRAALAVFDEITADGYPEVVDAAWDAMLDASSAARLARIFGQPTDDDERGE